MPSIQKLNNQGPIPAGMLHWKNLYSGGTVYFMAFTDGDVLLCTVRLLTQAASGHGHILATLGKAKELVFQWEV